MRPFPHPPVPQLPRSVRHVRRRDGLWQMLVCSRIRRRVSRRITDPLRGAPGLDRATDPVASRRGSTCPLPVDRKRHHVFESNRPIARRREVRETRYFRFRFSSRHCVMCRHSGIRLPPRRCSPSLQTHALAAIAPVCPGDHDLSNTFSSSSNQRGRAQTKIQSGTGSSQEITVSSRTHRWIAAGLVTTLVASFAVMTSTAYASVVTGVSASPSPLTAGAAATYTINFSTSVTGALAAGSGTITLTGPAGTQFPLTASDYTVNGSVVTAAPTDTATDNVTIITPVSVLASSSIAVVAGVGATATNTTDAETSSISVSTSVDITPVASSPGYTTVAGPATQDVATAGGGQNATVGTAFATPLNATIEDQFGNPVLASGTMVSFTAPASGASGTFANGTDTTSTTTNGSGVATATTFTANTTAGLYNVTTTSVGLTANLFAETNAAAAASQVVPTFGGGQNTLVGTVFTSPLSATIEDSHGNPVLVSGTTVTFTAPLSGASGTFVNGTDTTAATTNGSGVAISTTFTANSTAGTYSVAASSAGLTSGTFSETNVNAASMVAITTGGGQSTPIGTAFATPISATVEDSSGSAVLLPVGR